MILQGFQFYFQQVFMGRSWMKYNRLSVIDNNTSVQNNELRFTQVDLRKVAYINKLFIIASQAKQVFYIINPSKNR